MKKNKIIQVKAAVLMLVFSLNTVLGFACSLGLDLGYNKHHHEEQTPTVSHDHHAQHAEEATTATHHHSSSTESNEDDCCSNGVTTYNLLDKTIPQTNTVIHPVFAFAFAGAFFSAPVILFPQHDLLTNIRAFSQSYHPPIPDIRIAIQSFQI